MFMEREFVDTVIGIPGLPQSHRDAAAARRGSWAGAVELRPADHEPESPPPWRTNWGCATCHSKSSTCRRRWTGWLRTATAWSAASVSTRTRGAWPTCAGQRGSSFPRLSGLADATRRRSPWGNHPAGTPRDNVLEPYGWPGGSTPSSAISIAPRGPSSPIRSGTGAPDASSSRTISA